MPDKAFRSRRTEFRAADPAEGQPMTLSGYFVVFGQPYYIDDWCEEVVDRHAFDDADMTDVRALIDHDPRLCLGRHNDNVETLEFSIDDTGLFATIQINPDDTVDRSPRWARPAHHPEDLQALGGFGLHIPRIRTNLRFRPFCLRGRPAAQRAGTPENQTEKEIKTLWQKISCC